VPETYASLAITIAAAPSLSELEFPAVTIPSGPLTGRRPARRSRLVSGRGPSSVSNVPTGTISAAKWPFSIALTARWCEWSANSSSSARVRFQRWATCSAVWGIDMVVLASKRGFGKRQPIEVSKLAPGLAHALAGFSVTQGARVMDSTPPATTRSASPEATSARAVATAVRPEAHSRLTV
jgi:hypothetical protein